MPAINIKSNPTHSHTFGVRTNTFENSIENIARAQLISPFITVFKSGNFELE